MLQVYTYFILYIFKLFFRKDNLRNFFLQRKKNAKPDQQAKKNSICYINQQIQRYKKNFFNEILAKQTIHLLEKLQQIVFIFVEMFLGRIFIQKKFK